MLLLDSCLEGLMYRLLMAKWRSFAQYFFMGYMAVASAVLLLAVATAILLKQSPET